MNRRGDKSKSADDKKSDGEGESQETVRSRQYSSANSRSPIPSWRAPQARPPG